MRGRLVEWSTRYGVQNVSRLAYILPTLLAVASLIGMPVAYPGGGS